MGIVLFFVMAVLVALAIAYPLLPGHVPASWLPGVTDGDVDRAVRALRRSRKEGGRCCPACGQPYQPGDRFCVRCGATLPDLPAPQAAPACPSCGAPLRPGDRFCAKCGQTVTAGEVA